VIRGFEVKFQAGNLRRYTLAESLGYGESFRESWKKAAANEKDMKRLIDNWPALVKGVVVDPPEWLLNIDELTTGEVSAIAEGFIISAREVRKAALN
jgi:hypothetical protein